ncbi:MAG: MerR family transcriptional regulator, partial [Mobilitalea sp.]
MRIGEFAEVCKTRISVLRHYDKEGLLPPNFIDRFTGYRYYSANQVNVFRKITALKKAGFSLKEIKSVLSKSNNTNLILDSINRKKSELTELLSNLEEAKKIMLGAENMQNVIIIENTSGTEIRLSVRNPVANFYKSCEQLEDTAKRLDYQRISNFKTYGAMDSDQIDIGIDVIKLCNELEVLNEDINIPFVNDNVIGKWEVLGDYSVKDDFFSNTFNCETVHDDVNKQIFFLPGGEKYWCYGWTKGFLIIDTGDSTSLNSYEVEEHNGERYMFIQNKSYYY